MVRDWRRDECDYFRQDLLDNTLHWPKGLGKWLLEKVANNDCPRCGRTELNVYFSDSADNRVGAWCEFCDLKAYYFGEQLIPINS